jgi:hypothetical protein
MRASGSHGCGRWGTGAAMEDPRLWFCKEVTHTGGHIIYIAWGLLVIGRCILWLTHRWQLHIIYIVGMVIHWTFEIFYLLEV